MIRSIKECGLTGKAVTFRLDNEASLVSLVDRVGRSRSCPASAVITDVVAGYRPQSKGSIEKQVDVMKSGFWSVWLDLEAQITKALPEAPAEGVKLPLGRWVVCCGRLLSFIPLDAIISGVVPKITLRRH